MGDKGASGEQLLIFGITFDELAFHAKKKSVLQETADVSWLVFVQRSQIFFFGIGDGVILYK